MGTRNLPRQEMISSLVAHSVRTALTESPQYCLNDVFENGFVGYRTYSDRQLMLEMHLRGLLAREEMIIDDDEDEIDVDEDEESMLVQSFFNRND